MQPVSENSGINLTKPPTVYGMDLINGAHMTSQPAFPGQPYGGNKITYEQVDPSTFEDEDSDDDCHGSMPKPGKKTKGRVKIKMEFIENKLRRYTTFSKRKTGIMKKAYELSTLTGTQVMLLVASETGHVYTFATRKLQPMITSESGKALIQTCLNSPDPPPVAPGQQQAVEQRMNPTGFEETELTYAVEEETKVFPQMMGMEGNNGNIKQLFTISNSANGEQSYIQSPQPIGLSGQPQVQTQSIQPNIPRQASTPTPSSQVTTTTAAKTTTANNGIAVQLSQALPHGFILQPAGASTITIPVQNSSQQTTTSNPQTVYRIPQPQPQQIVANHSVLQPAEIAPQQTASSSPATQAAVNVLAATPQAASAMTPSVFMYSTPQGIVYAPATAGIQDKQIFNFQQIPTAVDTGGQQQIFAIPVPVSSLTGSPQVVQIAQSDTGQTIEVQAPAAKKPRK